MNEPSNEGTPPFVRARRRSAAPPPSRRPPARVDVPAEALPAAGYRQSLGTGDDATLARRLRQAKRARHLRAWGSRAGIVATSLVVGLVVGVLAAGVGPRLPSFDEVRATVAESLPPAAGEDRVAGGDAAAEAQILAMLDGGDALFAELDALATARSDVTGRLTAGSADLDHRTELAGLERTLRGLLVYTARVADALEDDRSDVDLAAGVPFPALGELDQLEQRAASVTGEVPAVRALADRAMLIERLLDTPVSP
ncbi:MAG: hypothetical protein AAFX81_06965 [Pseudomonadota bacterium]